MHKKYQWILWCHWNSKYRNLIFTKIIICIYYSNYTNSRTPSSVTCTHNLPINKWKKNRDIFDLFSFVVNAWNVKALSRINDNVLVQPLFTATLSFMFLGLYSWRSPRQTSRAQNHCQGAGHVCAPRRGQHREKFQMVSKRQLNVYLYIVFLRGIVYTERLSIGGMNYSSIFLWVDLHHEMYKLPTPVKKAQAGFVLHRLI